MLKISVSGINDIRKEIVSVKKRLTDFRKFFQEVARPELLQAFADTFETGQRTWAKLAVSTIKEKRRLGYPLKKLVRTGKLRKSYTQDTGDNSFVISKTSMRYTNLVDYAGFHEFGTRRIPKRQVIGRVIRKKEYQRKIVKALLAYTKQKGI